MNSSTEKKHKAIYVIAGLVWSQFLVLVTIPQPADHYATDYAVWHPFKILRAFVLAYPSGLQVAFVMTAMAIVGISVGAVFLFYSEREHDGSRPSNRALNVAFVIAMLAGYLPWFIGVLALIAYLNSAAFVAVFYLFLGLVLLLLISGGFPITRSLIRSARDDHNSKSNASQTFPD